MPGGASSPGGKSEAGSIPGGMPSSGVTAGVSPGVRLAITFCRSLKNSSRLSISLGWWALTCS